MISVPFNHLFLAVAESVALFGVYMKWKVDQFLSHNPAKVNYDLPSRLCSASQVVETRMTSSIFELHDLYFTC